MKFKFSRQIRIWLVVGVAVAGCVSLFFLPPLVQAEGYHHFADDRTFFGIPNFFNVISNAGFLIVGLLGLHLLWARTASLAFNRFIDPSEIMPYSVFFIGVLCACFGSGYYHWRPDDETLVWDRLPMTGAFMSLLAATVMERINLKAGLRLLWPLVIAGAGSVWWWRWTGNLWPYAAAQYFSILLIILLMLLFPPRYSRGGDIVVVATLYALAKILEALDTKIYAWSRCISGHTLKHIVAALAVYWIYRMLSRRSRLAVAPCAAKG